MKNQAELSQIDKLAEIFFQEKQFNIAAKLCDVAAVITDNKIPEILSKASLCHRLAADFETALDRISIYNLLVVNDVQGLTEQAMYYRWLGRYEDSEFIVQYLMPDSTSKTLSLGWHEMQRGNFKKSIELTEAGRNGCYWAANRTVPAIKRLDSNNVADKKILVCGESGAGDEIIFARWLPLLKERAHTVEYYTNNTLAQVFARQFGINVITDPANTTCDYYLPSMSLAHVLQVEEPGNAPYLTPDPVYVDKWHKQLGASTAQLIAVNGTGDLNHPENVYRSVPWVQLAGHIGQHGTLVAVQKTLNEPLSTNILNVADEITSWEDTLAILSLVGVVVTSCTSIAHAAGALGKPTIVLTNACDYFTWCNAPSGTQSSWYSNTWVIRQTQLGSWTNELIQAAALTKQLMSSV